MPKAHFRAALIAAAALSATLSSAAFAQETPPAETPPAEQPAEQPAADPAQQPAAEGQAPAGQTPTDQPGVTETKADPNEVVARVNGGDITRQQVIDSAAALPPEVQQQVDRLFPQLLERLITIQLLSAKGRADGLDKDPELQERVAEFENDLIGQTYFAKLLEQRMTPEAIQARYEKWVKENPAPEEVRAAHILVEKEEDAKAIIEQLKGGADFAAVAKEKSTDKGSGANGGELGWFTKEVMVKEFSDAAFAMKVDEVSAAPVKSQFGFHIIKLEERRTQATPTLDEKRGEIEADLAMEVQQAVIKELHAGAKIETLGPDGKLIEKKE